MQCRKKIKAYVKYMDITYDIIQVIRRTQSKILSIVSWSCRPKRLLCGIHGFIISICGLCPNLMRVKTGKVPHTHKKLACWKNNSIRVSKAVAINVTTNQQHQLLKSFKKNKTKRVRHIIIYQQHFEIKLLMCQKKALLDDGDNDDWK